MPDNYYLVSCNYHASSGNTESASVSLPETATPDEVGEIVRMLFRAGVENLVPPHGLPRYDDTSRAETRVFTTSDNLFNRL